jgi:ribosomal protein L7/L12
MNHYSAAIKIITDKSIDWHDLIVEIATHNPSAVVAAHARLNPNTSLETRCKRLMLANEKIKAIKLWREETGASLLDAKNAIGNLQ